jgi:hypothetical protein
MLKATYQRIGYLLHQRLLAAGEAP